MQQLETSCRRFTALVLTLIVGCSASPDAVNVSEVLDDEHIKGRALDFWSVSHVPKVTARSPRLAVAEFTIEYVREVREERALELIDKYQFPPASFDEAMKKELPAVLYQRFVSTLPMFNRHPLSLSHVKEAKAYQKLRPRPADDTHHPVAALRVIDWETEENKAVLRELVEELGVDTALCIRLRVGVRDGRGTIEDGSICVVSTAHEMGWLESKLTLISDRTVVDAASGESDSPVVAVNPMEFVRAIERLFRPYVSMALVAAGVER